jgi:hypothetical protein
MAFDTELRGIEPYNVLRRVETNKYSVWSHFGWGGQLLLNQLVIAIRVDGETKFIQPVVI